MNKNITITLKDRINITVVDNTKPFHKVYGNYELLFDDKLGKMRVRKVLLKDVYR